MAVDSRIHFLQKVTIRPNNIFGISLQVVLTFGMLKVESNFIQPRPWKSERHPRHAEKGKACDFAGRPFQPAAQICENEVASRRKLLKGSRWDQQRTRWPKPRSKSIYPRSQTVLNLNRGYTEFSGSFTTEFFQRADLSVIDFLIDSIFNCHLVSNSFTPLSCSFQDDFARLDSVIYAPK